MMGYLYYGYYSFYYEQARVETMRSLGIPYKRMEELGYLLPVRDLHIKFIKPAFYDDVVRITGHGFVHGVVHDFVDHFVQARCVLRSNVHPGALANCFEALEGRNFTFVVCVGFGH